MCGIAGIIDQNRPEENIHLMKEMISAIRHRGPDEFGIYNDDHACLGHARLSIIDLNTGDQPIHNEDKTLWIIYNGEVFNYPELRKELIKKGHHFATTSDTEVILHGYEEYGAEILSRLNGQFAFAIWDKSSRELFIARDRLGIRPLFYFYDQQRFIFASEIKAIFQDHRITPAINPFALSQIFTFWTTLYPDTIFKNIRELPPAHYLILKDGNIQIQRYWELSFPPADDYEDKPFSYWSENFTELLVDASLIRLRADVPVGAYLSGGLDSSVISAIIMNYTNNPMKTFSISFEEQSFDESRYQIAVSNHLGTDHRDQPISNRSVAENFPQTIWFTEKPILRTAPVPLMLLSDLVRRNNFKVVLTGEGADEFLGGYNIFKENIIRHFWHKYPNSPRRPLLLQKLYPYLSVSSPQIRRFTEQFFAYKLGEINHPAYSHLVRWRNYEQFSKFFSPDFTAQCDGYEPVDDFLEHIPERFEKWSPLSKAQYIEISLFMSGYLLSSQGDRMAMANSVEGRFPFLDHRLVEFCSKIPPKYKLRRMNEKYILKKTMRHLLPPEVSQRSKQPYRAPVAKCFYSADNSNYVEQIFKSNGSELYFQPNILNRFLEKWKRAEGNLASERDNMIFIGLLSTLLVHEMFITKRFQPVKNKIIENFKLVQH
ncbi:asparagine synthase (glutamine-hydrolyzing) [candidate division KSB1 bacterium]|nr:asparagine synthase (glutamine-hydrolyzing) [candidate division KSB1 bacterium]